MMTTRRLDIVIMLVSCIVIASIRFTSAIGVQHCASLWHCTATLLMSTAITASGSWGLPCMGMGLDARMLPQARLIPAPALSLRLSLPVPAQLLQQRPQ
jgi:hypothetical protein